MNGYRIFIILSSVFGFLFAYGLFVRESKRFDLTGFIDSPKIKGYLLKGYGLGIFLSSLILVIISS